MMGNSSRSAWGQLLEAGLILPGSEPEPDMEPEAPWFIKVLLAFCGWFASLLLLGFVGLGFVFVMDSAAASLGTGLAIIASAYALLSTPRNEFLEHLGLAVSLAGQGLVVWGLVQLDDGYARIPWLLILLVEAPLAILMPNFVHRVFSAFWAAVALSLHLAHLGAPYLANGLLLFGATWLWLNEFRYPQKIRKLQALGYGLVLALVPIGGSAFFMGDIQDWFMGEEASQPMMRPWMGELLVAAVALYLVWRLLKQERHHRDIPRPTVIGALAGTLLLCVAALEAQGIIVGFVITLLGFAAGNRVLLGLGLAAFLFYVSAYYYTLEMTLLAKSLTLLIVGVLLLLCRWLMLNFLAPKKEVHHG